MANAVVTAVPAKERFRHALSRADRRDGTIRRQRRLRADAAVGRRVPHRVRVRGVRAPGAHDRDDVERRHARRPARVGRDSADHQGDAARRRQPERESKPGEDVFPARRARARAGGPRSPERAADMAPGVSARRPEQAPSSWQERSRTGIFSWWTPAGERKHARPLAALLHPGRRARNAGMDGIGACRVRAVPGRRGADHHPVWRQYRLRFNPDWHHQRRLARTHALSRRSDPEPARADVGERLSAARP